MKNLSNVIRSRATRFVSLRAALVLCAVMAFGGLGVASAWNGGFEWLSMRKASAQSKAASAPEAAGQAQKPGITLGTSYHNDTSPRLRDMVQVPVTPTEVGFGQSIKAPEAKTDSGAILVSGISPDTNGEVGATQRVKIVNRGYQIFDNLTGTSVLGPSGISTIWAGFGGSCATGGAGHAVVLYDKVADRWVISQFASATDGKAATEECFAVSTTSDATGSYYRYAFHLGPNFIDSPHLSVRPDGYLMGDSVFNESGTERLGNQFFVFDRTAMLAGAAATFTSPGLDTGAGETYSISAHSVRVASAPSQPAVSTLTINLTYDPDATFTAAGLSAADITAMKAANTYAAQQFTSNYSDPINVNIQVTAVPGTGTLGMSSTFVPSTTFANMVAKTVADATTPDDMTATGAGGSIPATLVDPTGATWRVSKAQSKALGISADDLTMDGTYTFGGGFSYTYDPLNRAVAGKIDYIGVSMHEFSEIMGRIGLMGQVIGTASYMQFDLFHYTGAGARGLNNGAGRSFSINNGTTLLKAFNNAAVNGGDLQDWASGTNDAFNAFSSSSVLNDLSTVDLRNMDVIGYNFGCTLPPSITCPANITKSTDPGVCSAVVNYPAPTVSDICSSVGTPTCSPASGSTFPKGTTTVTCSVTDAANNTSTCSFTVTVNDTQPPTITCPPNKTQSTDPGLCSAVVTYNNATATDNCPGVGTPVCIPASGSTFPRGITTVTCNVSDASGNTASCTFTITVNDTQPPMISCPPNQTAVTDQNACPAPACQVVNYPPPTVSDNCPGVTFACNPPSGSCFPTGVTTVTCTATDSSGNTATCTFTVTTFDTALEDDSNPAIILLWNSITGQYLFCCPSVPPQTGVGKATRQGCVYTLDHTYAADRRVLGRVDKAVHAGSGALQRPPGTIQCTITDRNTLNDPLAPLCQ